MTDITIHSIEKKIKLPNYSRGEELINTISHGVGAALGLCALILCLIRSAGHHNGYGIASSIVFGLSLMLLYSMSAVYHGVRPSIAKRVLRVFDHCTIYLLIAGSYTPFTLLTLHGTVGWVLFAIIWSAAILGIIINTIDVERFKVFSMICYLSMGWCVIFTFPTLYRNLQPFGLRLLIYGGIAYTLGAVIYGIGSKIKYMHSIWHFLVIAGSIFHFFCIFCYVL